MSSHHFVKEGQEPALFILEALSFEHVGPLLEWAPLVICSAAALESVLSWGIKVDVVMGTAKEEGSVKQQMTEFMQMRYLFQDKAETVYDVLFDFLSSENQFYVNVVGSSPANMISFYQERHNIFHVAFITSSHRWVAVANGHYRKWYPRDLTVIVMGGENLRTEGLTQLDHRSWLTSENGLVSMHSAGIFWVGEPL